MSKFLKRLFCCHTYINKTLIDTSEKTDYDDSMERMTSGYESGKYVTTETLVFKSECVKCGKIKYSTEYKSNR